MAGKPVFSEQAEQFTMIVHALLQNKETRAAFAKEPLSTLKQYGIEFKDPAVAKKVEAELAVFAGKLSDDDICPPWTIVPRTWTIGPRTWTQTMTRNIPIVRAVNITWVAKGDLDDVIKIDQPRVDAFVTQVSLETRIAVLEARIVELEANLAKR
jgi:hypothetical protein